jgi:murein DD-endopeptidase MepM/ murein hydrolase activator NlpD
MTGDVRKPLARVARRLRARLKATPWAWALGVGIALLLGGLGLLMLWRYRRGAISAGRAPTPLPVPQTPAVADAFGFPLPPAQFGPYLPYESGPLPVDTRFGAQNPGVGAAGKCFVDAAGTPVPFNQLYHAGEDWFAVDEAGQVQGRGAAGAPVRAVAAGTVTWVQSLGPEGFVVIAEHRLPQGDSAGERVWSVYWHVAHVRVAQGQAVARGDVIGQVHDRGLNSHLHWELRAFADGSDRFPPESAGGRGTCNGYVAGVGYTWDDDPTQARPEAWGYLDPVAFITARAR